MAQPGRAGAIASHRITRLIVASGVGLALAFYALQFASDPRTAGQRAAEEAAVRAGRNILERYVGGNGPLEIADPLAPNRALGKAFIYPAGDGEVDGHVDGQGDGYEISGWYRRAEGDTWHPFLMRLDGRSQLVRLSIRDRDPALRRRAAEDPKLVVR